MLTLISLDSLATPLQENHERTAPGGKRQGAQAKISLIPFRDELTFAFPPFFNAQRLSFEAVLKLKAAQGRSISPGEDRILVRV